MSDHFTGSARQGTMVIAAQTVTVTHSINQQGN
jgi:hypothetical protein